MSLLHIIPGLFKQRKPRRFNYRPVFYDRRKESLEERIKKYKDLQKTGGPELFGHAVIRKGSFREFHSRTHRNIHRQSNTRLIIIMALLFCLMYILFLR